MKLTFNFTQLNKLVIVGCGGTGGYLIPKLFRHIHTIPELATNLEIFLVDDDIVEEKNIGRQNFSPQDVGHPKARIMAMRYGATFGLKVRYLVERADKGTYEDIWKNSGNMLIIDTVDNNKAREQIHLFIQDQNYYMRKYLGWISAGNSQNDGQIVVFPFSQNNNDMDYKRTVVDVWPDQFTEEVFEEERAREEEANCAINAQVNPQSMAANDTSATVIYNVCHEAIHQGSIEHDIIFFTTFNEINKIPCGEDPFGCGDDMGDLVAELEGAADNRPF